MVWRQTGEGPVFERMMTQFAKHVYVTGGGGAVSDFKSNFRLTYKIKNWTVKS